MENKATEAADIMALGSALSDPLSAAPPTAGASTPFVVVPEGYKVNGLEALFPLPARSKGTTKLDDADSFIRFVNQNKTDHTRLYCKVGSAPSFSACFNDTFGMEPGWGDHMAAYTCPLSVEWKTWTGSNGKQMSQADFSRFVEDNAPDCVSPSAADMIEIARSLEAKKSVNFSSAVRLDNGQSQLTYEETIQGTAAKGRLVVPETFSIGIPVFESDGRYAVTARLRYRIAEGGKLSLWYDLVRPHKIIEDAVKELRAVIEARTELTAFAGG